MKKESYDYTSISNVHNMQIYIYRDNSQPRVNHRDPRKLTRMIVPFRAQNHGLSPLGAHVTPKNETGNESSRHTFYSIPTYLSSSSAYRNRLIRVIHTQNR